MGGTLEEGDIQPYEGENGISWSTTGLGWFGAGIMSMQPVNLFNFSEGHLNFSIKIPSNISFQIGIIDAWGNQSYVNFPSNQTTYGLVRKMVIGAMPQFLSKILEENLLTLEC